tara:strand:+ start:465 stop:671 length:207 start_codon:yes stop_codon:yes gene_type:complete
MIIDITKKEISRTFNLLSRLKTSSVPHFRNGPKIIPNTSGIVIGARIELKKGAPTEILVLKNTLEIKG